MPHLSGMVHLTKLLTYFRVVQKIKVSMNESVKVLAFVTVQLQLCAHTAPHHSHCVFSTDNAFILIRHFREGSPYHPTNGANGAAHTSGEHTKEVVLWSGYSKYHIHTHTHT